MTRRILVWTAQIAKHRRAKALGVFFLDSTAMSGNKAFAPEMRNVLRYKNNELDEEDYTKLYVAKMRHSVMTKNSEWEKLLGHDKFIIACYCRAGNFCHRHILLDLFTKYAATQDTEVINMGEFLEDADLSKQP